MIGRRLVRGAGELRQMSGLADPADWLGEALGGGRTAADVTVHERSAIGLPAIMAPVSVLAEDVGKLPLHVYERTGPRARERRADDPVARLLALEPNPEMTALAFWEAIAGFVKLWNRAYAYIERDRLGRIIALWPMAPDRTRPARDLQTSELLGYRTEVGTNREPVDLLPEDVLAYDGGLFAGDGKSPIMRHREAIGISVAAEEYAARYFANDASTGGMIEVPADAPDGAADRLWAKWQARHGGLSRKFTVGMLEGGAKWKDVGAAPRDAQFVELQKWGVLQGCRIFRVPPHKVADLERATFSNIEEQNIEYVTDSLGGVLRRIELENRRKLWPTSDYGLRGERYCEFLVDHLLRGDIEKRYRAYAIGRQWGWLSADDVRERENLTPLPDGQGEHYLQPLNMVPAGAAGELLAPAGQRGDQLELRPEHELREAETLERVVRFLARSAPSPGAPWPIDVPGDVDSGPYRAQLPMHASTNGS